jgi:hypothetical protein
MVRKRPGSARVGYGLKTAIMPCRMNIAKSGSCLELRTSSAHIKSKMKDYLLEFDTDWCYVDEQMRLVDNNINLRAGRCSAYLLRKP